jgi:sugar phosphate isomerase/epimerase
MKTKQTRRDFLRLTAAGTIGAVVLSNYSCKNQGKAAAKEVDLKSFGVGIQLYTLRDALAADVPGSLKRISDLGYKYLELADYADGKFYGYAPLEFKKLVNDLGMEIISSHTQVEGVGVTPESAKKMAEDHALIGAQYCIQPWIVEEMRTSVASYQRMAANWNQIGQVMKDAGLQFGYHNHNFEFATVEGKIPYFDIMMAELDKNLVIMELDTFWVTKAGHNPVDIINKYPGRFHLLHFKDAASNQPPFFEVIKDDIAPVGTGVIDFKAILAVKETAGAKYLIVEQDETKGDMWADVQTSITNLTTRILV